MALEADVAVIGSGAMAGAVAWELARAGRRPLVVAGVPSPPVTGHVATGPAIAYAQAVRDLGHAVAGEVWECYRESHERLRSFLTGLPEDCGYRQPGGFLLALERAGAALLADSEDMLREDGFAGEFLDHYMLEARLPLSGFSGAYWAADDAEVDAGRLAEALRRSAEERGAVVADVGAVREVVAGRSIVEVVADRGLVKAGHVVVADAAALVAAGRAGMTRTETVIEAGLVEGLEPPSLARSEQGRFRWRSGEGVIRLEVDRRLDLEKLLGQLPAREPSLRGEAIAFAAGDRLPAVGPTRKSDSLLLACASEPCGIALAVARWIADGLRTGKDPTPGPFRAARA